MTIAERIFALRRSPPFDRLFDSEIGPMARACRVRDFAPGEMVAHADRPLRHLFVVVEGEVRRGEVPLPRVFGESSLLLGHPPGAELLAGGGGARCLLLGRGHFFTLVNECPWLLEGVLDRLTTHGIAEIGIAAGGGA